MGLLWYKRGWDGQKKKIGKANEKRKMGKVNKERKRWGGEWTRVGKGGKGCPGPTRGFHKKQHQNKATVESLQLTYVKNSHCRLIATFNYDQL